MCINNAILTGEKLTLKVVARTQIVFMTLQRKQHLAELQYTPPSNKPVQENKKRKT